MALKLCQSEIPVGIGLTEDHGACRPETGDRGGILCRFPVTAIWKSPARRQAADIEGLLDRQGNSEQWSPLAAPKRCVGLQRRHAGAFEVANHHRVDRAVTRLDAIDRVFRKFFCRNLPRIEHRAQLAHAAIGKISGAAGGGLRRSRAPPRR
jgi:hypothetical protein